MVCNGESSLGAHSLSRIASRALSIAMVARRGVSEGRGKMFRCIRMCAMYKLLASCA